LGAFYSAPEGKPPESLLTFYVHRV